MTSDPAPGSDRAPRSCWARGELVVRLRHRDGAGAGRESRLVEINQPYARIGRAPWSDLYVPDPALNSRHLYLHLDPRGIFAVDLVGQPGTRLAGRPGPTAWLDVGDIIELGPYLIELIHARVGEADPVPEAPRDGRRSDDRSAEDTPARPDLLCDAVGRPLTRLAFEVPVAPAPAAPELRHVASEIAFLGRGAMCAVRIDHPSVSQIHCAVVRTSRGAYLVRLSERPLKLDDRGVARSAALPRSAGLTLGEVALRLHLGPPSHEAGPGPPAILRPTPIAEGRAHPHDARPGDDRLQQLMTTVIDHVNDKYDHLIERQDRFEANLLDELQQLRTQHLPLIQKTLREVRQIQSEITRIHAALAAHGVDPSRAAPTDTPRPAGHPPRDPQRIAGGPARPGAGSASAPKPRPTPTPPGPDQAGPAPEASTAWLLRRAAHLEGESQRKLDGLLGLLNRITRDG